MSVSPPSFLIGSLASVTVSYVLAPSLLFVCLHHRANGCRGAAAQSGREDSTRHSCSGAHIRKPKVRRCMSMHFALVMSLLFYLLFAVLSAALLVAERTWLAFSAWLPPCLVLCAVCDILGSWCAYDTQLHSIHSCLARKERQIASKAFFSRSGLTLSLSLCFFSCIVFLICVYPSLLLSFSCIRMSLFSFHIPSLGFSLSVHACMQSLPRQGLELPPAQHRQASME